MVAVVGTVIVLIGTLAQPASAGPYTVDYQIMSVWAGGFQVKVTLTNSIFGTDDCAWSVGWAFTQPTTITSYWDVTISQPGSSVSAHNVSYNGRVDHGRSATFGFVAASVAPPTVPFPINVGFTPVPC
jgi:cellulase/cellobiase CelA1